MDHLRHTTCAIWWRPVGRRMRRYTVRMGLIDGKHKFERMVRLAETEPNYTREGQIELRAFPSGEVLLAADLGEKRRAAKSQAMGNRQQATVVETAA